MSFEDAISENDKALAEYRKKPVVKNDEILEYKKYNTKQFIVKLSSFYEHFKNILELPPRNLKVILVGPQREYIPALLSNGNSVTWFMTGNSTFGSIILEIQNQYPTTFKYIPKSLFDKVAKNEQVPADIVMVDVNTTNNLEFSAVVSSPLFTSILSNQEVIPTIIAHGHVPLSKSSSSILTCTWLSLFKLGFKSWYKKSLHPETFTWLVSFEQFKLKEHSEILKQLDSIWKRVLSRSNENTVTCTNSIKEIDELFENVTKIVSKETEELHRITKNRVSLPKSEWTPIITNEYRCSERPYTPSIHSSLSLQIGFDYKDNIIERFYETNANEPNPICHWGQLKLLISEMEFLFECRSKNITEKAIIVYIGASPGEHINLLIRYFPEIKHWLLIDPSKSTVVPQNKVEIVRKKATDEYVKQIGVKYSNDTIIYINDMRTETNENTVAKEMVTQAKWGIHLRSKALLLKLRFPYLERDGYITSKDIYNSDFCLTKSDIDVVKKMNIRKEGCLKPGFVHNRDTHVWYLAGVVQPQVFAPSTSTESRLIVFPDNKYEIGEWDVLSFESCMHDFNKRMRMRQDGYNVFDDIPVSDIVGIDDTYECSRMVNSFRLVFPKTFKNEIKEALKYLSYENKNLVTCSLKTMRQLSQNKNLEDALYFRIYEFWERLWDCRISDHKHFVSGNKA